MGRTEITAARVAIMTVFAMGTFGVLLFLWQSFGGPVPLKAEGYRVSIDFPDAGRLATQADVRISGVSVGRVVRISRAGPLTRAVIELQPRYVPLPSDVRALLRQKSALGETYVDLTPGTHAARPLPEGGHLPSGQVADAVLLDEALKAFDPGTRRALQAYLRGWATAVDGRGGDLSGVLARLAPTEVQATRVLDVLHAQRGAVDHVLGDGGRVLAAVGARQAAVRTLIRDGDAVFATTAARSRELRATVRALPGLVRAARTTTTDLRATGSDLAPALRRLQPAARDLGPLLRSLARGAPPLRAAVAGLQRVATAAITAVPATTRLLAAVPGLSRALDPVARDLDPVLEYLGRYKTEITSPFAVVAAVSQATEKGNGGKPRHYVRLVPNLTSETPTIARVRPASDRFNPYPAPRWLDQLATGLASFSCDHVGNLVSTPALGTGAPPCRVQAPVRFRGAVRAFPHLTRDPPRPSR